MTKAMVKKKLFYDRTMERNPELSCSSILLKKTFQFQLYLAKMKTAQSNLTKIRGVRSQIKLMQPLQPHPLNCTHSFIKMNNLRKDNMAIEKFIFYQMNLKIFSLYTLVFNKRCPCNHSKQFSTIHLIYYKPIIL